MEATSFQNQHENAARVLIEVTQNINQFKFRHLSYSFLGQDRSAMAFLVDFLLFLRFFWGWWRRLGFLSGLYGLAAGALLLFSRRGHGIIIGVCVRRLRGSGVLMHVRVVVR